MLSRTYEELQASENSITPAEAGFQDFHPQSPRTEHLQEHSMKNLLLVQGKPPVKQAFSHRGLFSPFKRIPENSIAALREALTVCNCVEVDVIVLKTGEIVLAHDELANRVADLPKRRWEHLTLDEVHHAPMIIREVKHGQFTDRFVLTEEKIITLGECLDSLTLFNQEATINLDCRNADAEVVAAWLTQNPKYLDNVIVQLYYYGYKSGAEFVRKAEERGADMGVLPRLAITPVVWNENLKELAAVGRTVQEVLATPAKAQAAALATAGLTWIQSFRDESLRIFGVSLILAGPGANVDFSSNPIVDPKNQALTGDALQAFIEDRALILIGTWIRQKLPQTPVVGICRAYDLANGGEYKFHYQTGDPVPWPTDNRRLLSEALATPGISSHYLDVVITDRLYDTIRDFIQERQGLDMDCDFDFELLKIREV